MTDSISQWAYSRSVELRRDAEFIGDTFARYIEAHEPPPVDPLLIEARRIYRDKWSYDSEDGNRALACDEGNSRVMAALIAALRRGMELARGEAGRG